MVAVRGELIHADTTKREPAEELHGRDRVALLLPDDIRERRLLRTERYLFATPAL